MWNSISDDQSTPKSGIWDGLFSGAIFSLRGCIYQSKNWPGWLILGRYIVHKNHFIQFGLTSQFLPTKKKWSLSISLHIWNWHPYTERLVDISRECDPQHTQFNCPTFSFWCVWLLMGPNKGLAKKGDGLETKYVQYIHQMCTCINIEIISTHVKNIWGPKFHLTTKHRVDKNTHTKVNSDN